MIVAFAVFVVVKQVNRLFPKSPAVPSTKECGFCAMSIPLKARRCPHCTAELAAT
jgi:large conductance mechanosensitive channel